jgi:hypothetical protein
MSQQEDYLGQVNDQGGGA